MYYPVRSNTTECSTTTFILPRTTHSRKGWRDSKHLDYRIHDHFMEYYYQHDQSLAPFNKLTSRHSPQFKHRGFSWNWSRCGSCGSWCSCFHRGTYIVVAKAQFSGQREDPTPFRSRRSNHLTRDWDWKILVQNVVLASQCVSALEADMRCNY